MLIDKFFYTLKIGGLSFIQSIILFFTLLKLIELKEIEKRFQIQRKINNILKHEIAIMITTDAMFLKYVHYIYLKTVLKLFKVFINYNFNKKENTTKIL